MKATNFLLSLAIVLSACSPSTTPAATVTPVPPTAIPTNIPEPTATAEIHPLSAKADMIFQNATKAGTFSGSVLIAQNGQVILSQGYGFADREKKIPNTPQTKFRISTLTQPFTALAILLLQEQGKLNVQDKLCTYLTDCPDSWQPITLHHLLTHSSGIADATTFSLPPDELIAKAKTKTLSFQPGDRYIYSATGYNLLGRIVEAVSNQSYEDFLQKNILDPLKMSNTGYDHGQADLAVGYLSKGATVAFPVNRQGLFAAGALYSTVEDLYLWDQALYTDKLVSQKTLDAMFTGYVQNPYYPAGMKAGYGNYAIILPSPPRLIEVLGYIDGFGFVSEVHRWPDDNIIIIILTNQQDVYAWDNAAAVNRELFGR